MAEKSVEEKKIVEALGPLNSLLTSDRIFFTHRIDESFQPMPEPGSGDWLRAHPEPGQTFEAFQGSRVKATPDRTRKTIFIQPYGKFDDPRAPPLSTIAEFCKGFYLGCDVVVLANIEIPGSIRRRVNPWNTDTQYHTVSFHEDLYQRRAKRDPCKELVCCGVTMEDLYPEDSWNFVYGQAKISQAVGIYSFARLDPKYLFKSNRSKPIPLEESERILILRRSLKILLHELGHLFGLRHCIYYICLMNGANHEVEMDRQPLHLCPICLRKLHSTFKFNIATLYDRFAKLCQQYQFEDEYLWYKTRLEHLRGH